MDIDAEASLRCWAIQVTLAGRHYRIPPKPASDWLPAITGHYHLIVPGMVEDTPGPDSLFDRILARQIETAECNQAARDAITAASGMKWWTATRLSSWLLGNWSTMGGAILGRGMVPAQAPLGAVLTLTYRILLENCKDEQERQRVDMELERPPAGTPIAQMYDPNKASANFMALAATDGG